MNLLYSIFKKGKKNNNIGTGMSRCFIIPDLDKGIQLKNRNQFENMIYESDLKGANDNVER